MSFWDKVKDFTRPYADEEYDDYEDEMDTFEEEEQEAPRSRRSSPFTSAVKEEEPVVMKHSWLLYVVNLLAGWYPSLLLIIHC